ncbi:MAG TPA: hypothetical protein VMW42_02720, partial [Desulfatiglandales bacterium]|nr:hypothetical protein [Desulfatiglandales bacterium]
AGRFSPWPRPGFREPENSMKLSRQGGPISADPPASEFRNSETRLAGSHGGQVIILLALYI